ncbi:hypothetical protein [Leeuwenhoekiella sp. MAR_2009_132]|uniref:hypothetical protein n=1 Tax=Leeuwenhoekiella sp. MAR_2009_132 TaxID=1392489 RepID=UPI00048B664C|nr:hypothetical protein [Leeuwenhoekiella sp. MAR_2009_132]
MKHFLLIACFLFASFTIHAQNYKSTIKSTFSEYLDAIVNSDFEKAMDYMLPEFFDIIPRAQLVSIMEQTFNNPQMSFKIRNPEVLRVEDAQEIEDKFYAMLTYANDMDMQLKGEENETEEQKAMRTGLTQAAFAQSFGKDNVKYKDSTDSYTIHAEKEVIAISNNGTTDWKFIVLENRQNGMLEKLVPAALLEQN